MRLFVAIVPPPAVVAELSRQLSPLQAGSAPGLRWTDPGTWHVTLAFLGDVPEAALGDLGARLELAARGQPAASLRLRGGSAFPSAARAGVVTAVVTTVPRPTGRRPLAALAVAVADAARQAGAPPPAGDPPFRAHLTLARLRPSANVSPLLAGLAGLAVGPWRAADIRLIRSHLGGPSGPPRYAELARWPLGPPPA
jgi:2'-5' RNA ligase